MNWIEVTKDTKIKCGTKVLIKTTYGQFIVAEVTDFDNVLLLSNCKDSGTYCIHDYTHYSVITDPNKVNPIKSIRYLLDEADYELDKWDSRRDITYNDTDYIAAGVNFGKKEALQDVLRILWGLD